MKTILSSLLRVNEPEHNNSITGARTIDVGWLLQTDKASFIWDAPRRLSKPEGKAAHAKGVSYCPAVIDFEARYFEIPCPLDVELRFVLEEGKKPGVALIAGKEATIRPKHLNSMMTVVNREEWRHPNRPLIQFITPYLFVTDEPVYMSQLPPFCHYFKIPLPGVMIDGRMPIHIWPRPLMWAFEWYDTNKPLVLKRGEPWFYLHFETSDPSRRVRMVEVEMTPALGEYLSGLTGVTNYVSRTYSLFRTAEERRPKKLLSPKQR